ncbi:cation:proton antiporter [Sphingobium yanoikuyae]|uniref:Sodium:proton exchanger n=1 Tax=Sphingobium yanoikuyae TaxID=13690 RepID=A0A430BFN5_SPHYA|nr:cation:proton antiporter [Sphingobium yanoikuyae]RSU48389.1 sodium:proton exchanger [Sphingobium yanoikuyae]
MEEALVQTFLLISAAFVAVALLTRLRLSPIVGYLAAGLLLGPTGLGVISHHADATHFFGELGIALLMFVIGLEFSIPRLVTAGKSVLFLGAATLAGTGGIVATLAHLLGGIPFLQSAIIGGAVAMSSTAIVHKHLIDTDETASRHGLAATGIVLFEDLVALALIALVSALHGTNGSGEMEPVLGKLAVSLVAFAVVALLARRTLGRLLGWVARSKVNEVFLLAVLTMVVGASLAAQSLGLSLPLGAFIVGMMVAESDFRHQLEDEIRPFRDLLLGVFFITVGMSVDWAEIGAAPGITLAVFATIIVVKLAVVFVVSKVSGMGFGSALKAGLLLAHAGELGLLVIERCLEGSLLSPAIGQPILGAVAISMLTGPMLAQLGDRLINSLNVSVDKDDLDHAEGGVHEAGGDLDKHVILAGCGPVGRLVAVTLENAGIKYLAVERNIDRLRRAQADGHKVVFGDATRPGILDAAGIVRARAMVVLVNDWHRSTKIIREARRLNPALQIIASLRDDTHLSDLVEAGASHIFPENYASGLGLAAQALMSLGVPPAEAMEKIRSIRAELSPELRLLPS